jgi:hypothetical protein
MRWILRHAAVLLLVSVPLTGCSKSDEYYEMLGEQWQVSTLLSHVQGLTAIAARTDKAPELAAKAQAALDAQPGASGTLSR